MNSKIQVHRSHYDFANYMTKERWLSMYEQLNLLSRFSVEDAAEVGAGAGILKAVAKTFGVDVTTIDIDKALKPDVVGSITDIPLPSEAFAASCAFQVMEHLPFSDSIVGFKELCRIASRYVIISLPDATPYIAISAQASGISIREMTLSVPIRRKEHEFDGQHFWEIGKGDKSVRHIIGELARAGNVSVNATYRCGGFPYHRFFVFEK